MLLGGGLHSLLTAYLLAQGCALSDLLQRTSVGTGDKERLHHEGHWQTCHHPCGQEEHVPGRHIDSTDL